MSYEVEFTELYRGLVPPQGEAPTVQGEMVRAIARLSHEYRNNGNMNWNEHYDAFVALLSERLEDPTVFRAEGLREIQSDLGLIAAFPSASPPRFASREERDHAERAFSRVADRVVEWCRAHPEPLRRTTEAQAKPTTRAKTSPMSKAKSKPGSKPKLTARSKPKSKPKRKRRS